MYCSHCGKQISDNAKFCNFCGAEQVIYNQASAAQSQQARSQTPKAPPAQSWQAPQAQPSQAQAAPRGNNNSKPKSGVGKKILIGLLVFVGVCLLSRVFLTPLFLKSLDKDKPSPAPSADILTPPTVNQPYVDYDADDAPQAGESDYFDILDERGIPIDDEPLEYSAWLSSKSFVKVYSDGMLEKMQFGYDPEDDSIVEMFDILYLPNGDLSVEQVAALNDEVHKRLAPFEEENFCATEYEAYTTYGYYKATVHFTDINNSYCVGKFAEWGLLPDAGAGTDFISMTSTETSLIAGGYVMR